MDMLQLRPLVVITGTIHVEGGAKSSVHSVQGRKKKKAPRSRKNARQLTVVHHRTVSLDRDRANVIATNYSRKLLRMRLLRTPFGTLLEPAKLNDFKKMMMEIATVVAVFNKGATRAQVTNGWLWENLSGVRLAAVRGWLAQQSRHKNEDVREALPLLRRFSSAA